MAASTLAQAIESSSIGMQQLQREYRPMLRIVRELIGVIPNCDMYLEIWPTGFRTYNLLVPNLLNLPQSVMGQGAPKDLQGLAMYVSSRAAECMYCSAHTCSYALRRGASRAALTGEYNDTEAALVTLAEALGRVPSDVTHTHVKEVEQYLAPDDIEWLVLSVALMGFLNKFMDAMGIELEAEAIADVKDLIEPTGWNVGKHQWDDDIAVPQGTTVVRDGLGTYFRMARQVPGAVRLEGKWTKGVSGRVGAALMMLEEEVGYAFPIFASLQHRRAVRAIATVLRDNLDPDHSVIGLPAKCMVALVFAKTVGNDVLVAEAVQLAEQLAPEIDPQTLVEVGHFAATDGERAIMPSGLTQSETTCLLLAKAGSTSPSNINDITISTVTEQLTPAAVIEVVTWLSVLQMLHRLYCFYDAKLGLR